MSQPPAGPPGPPPQGSGDPHSQPTGGAYGGPYSSQYGRPAAPGPTASGPVGQPSAPGPGGNSFGSPSGPGPGMPGSFGSPSAPGGGSFGGGSGNGPGGPGSPGGPFGGSPTPPPSGPSRPEGPTLINGATTHGVMGQKAIRHPAELPLLWVGVSLTLLSYLLWTILMFSTVYLRIAEGQASVDELWRWISIAPFLIQLALILPLAPFLIFWGRAIYYAQLRAVAVRMSPTQFPEGYRMVVEAAEKFGMRKVPDAYVLLGNGVINAFAAGHGFRRYVVLHSDMFEIGGATRDPEALRFVVGHEVGHLAAGHVSYFRQLFTVVIGMIPFLGPAFSRSQEYTADNFGYAFAPGGAPGVIGVLAGGKYLNAEVNVNEVADRAATDPSFFVHWVNWFSSHPITTWRAHALRDRSKPGSLMIRPKGALYTSPLPPGHVWSSRYPSPGDALAMLDAADRARPAGAAGQFGRFPGVDYSDRPAAREMQTAAPQLSPRTGYVIPPGPYADDARGSKATVAPQTGPYGPGGGQPPMPPQG
ncbi:M48 family metallopeptidase [Brachybacterium sp. J153]|uniref:M48 family metallopeptidase n=1 Tax=Brachybacterium sp. J153 TaxID=3116488 RepID=UPI002E766CFD|nr:M48 family metallopeptidase [Brachybacterium sp. J153]MEE1619496.1 M48 family metallopeptidase [Brachybacterium sp. J153]